MTKSIFMKELTDEQFELLNSHSQMLGVIGVHLEEFCQEEDTVLVGVLRLLAQYYTLKSNELYDKIEALKNTV